MASFDVLLKGGLIVDGTGGEPYFGDVGVIGDTITALDEIEITPSSVKRVVDCNGLVVTPGFIDIHTHSDISFLLDPLANSKIMQGVTTEVVGNCGFSPFPATEGRQRLWRSSFAA